MHVADEVNDEAQRLAALFVWPQVVRERRRELHDGGEHVALRNMLERIDRGSRLRESRARWQIGKVDVVPRHGAFPRGIITDRVRPEPDLSQRLSLAEVGHCASRSGAELALGKQACDAMELPTEREHLRRQRGRRSAQQRACKRSASRTRPPSHGSTPT
jgi:hypothetical protein